MDDAEPRTGSPWHDLLGLGDWGRSPCSDEEERIGRRAVVMADKFEVECYARQDSGMVLFVPHRLMRHAQTVYGIPIRHANVKNPYLGVWVDAFKQGWPTAVDR